jgi:hypothetical protein
VGAGEFAVADISNIDWSPLPYDGLTIPGEKKEVVMALAESRMGRGDSTPSDDVGERQERDVPFDDFVEGKGRGLIVLLQYALGFSLCSHELTRNSGSPGVGKTLTAEAISERLKRPFYSVCDMS